MKLPTFCGAKAEGTARMYPLPVPHSPQFPYRPMQSNDSVVMEVLSDIMSQLPLTVESEDVSEPGLQSTFSFIVSSPIWERLHENIQGK